MYLSWLDQWDERRAQRGEEGKKLTGFTLDSERAFPNQKTAETITEFCRLADRTVGDPTFFEEPSGSDMTFQRNNDFITFTSGILTEVKNNNIAHAKITDSGSFKNALVVFHHWNASSRQRRLASYFAHRGVTVAEIAMPYHFERSRTGSAHADFMLSPNLGRTIQSVRQAVWDGRRLIGYLKNEGYQRVSVLGMSLGSWVAGLIAAHDENVAKASLFLTADSLADMVWTGRATRMIHASLEPNIGLADLNRAWGPLSLENYSARLARKDLDLQLVLAKRDRVVLPELSERFIRRLQDAGAILDTLRLNCGHYSLALPPHILFAGSRLKRFVMSN